MLGHYVRALRWKYILYSVKPDVKMWNLFGALMIGYGVNCVTPKLGEVTRAIMIGRYENLSRSSMFGTVIVERVIDIISLGTAVLISAFIWSASLYETFPWLEITLYISALALVCGSAYDLFISKVQRKILWIHYKVHRKILSKTC